MLKTVLGVGPQRGGGFHNPEGRGPCPPTSESAVGAVHTPGSPRQQEVDLAQQRLYIGSGFCGS